MTIVNLYIGVLNVAVGTVRACRSDGASNMTMIPSSLHQIEAPAQAPSRAGELY